MTIYKSTIDLWLMLLVFVPFAYAIVSCIVDAEYEALYLLIPIVAALVILFSQIKYIISNDTLIVKGGLCNVKIEIKDIRSIHATHNPLSAPALSVNRLEIKYGNKFDYVLISPKEKVKFIDELKALNPDIDVR